MPSSIHNPFVSKIFPVTLLNSKLLTLVPSDSKRSGGRGWRPFMSFYPSNIPRCEHIKTNGTQCGSPALRHKKLCFFHERWQAQRLAIADSVASIPAGISIAPALNMPVLEDANSIQVAIMQVLQLLLTGQLEHKTAALALYALQTASSNLRGTRFDPYPHDVVINPATVDETLMGEDIWKNSDFNAVEEDDEEETEEDDAATDDGAPRGPSDDNNSLEENAVPPLPEHSAPRTLQTMSDALPPNWREELRTQIAARVQHSALEGTWINEMVRSSSLPSD